VDGCGPTVAGESLHFRVRGTSDELLKGSYDHQVWKAPAEAVGMFMFRENMSSRGTLFCYL